MKTLKGMSALLLVGLMLGGCADSSDSLAAQKEAMTAAQTQAIQESGNEVTTETSPLSQAEILAAVPKTVTEEFTSSEGVQKIDAEVILPEGMFTTGTLEPRDFSEEEIKELLKESKFVDDVEQLQIIIESDLITIYDVDYEKNQEAESEEELPNTAEYQQLANELMQQLGSEQVVKEENSYRGKNGDVYEFWTTAMIHGTLLEKKSQPKAYSSSGTLIDGKLGSLSIHADYMIEEENEVSLMGFSDILKSFEILMDSGMIAPAPSGQTVDKIQLCYMAESKGRNYTFYPVWNFEMPYVADWLKDCGDGPHVTRYVVLNACTGELVEHHIGGVE